MLTAEEAPHGAFFALMLVARAAGATVRAELLGGIELDRRVGRRACCTQGEHREESTIFIAHDELGAASAPAAALFSSGPSMHGHSPRAAVSSPGEAVRRVADGVAVVIGVAGTFRKVEPCRSAGDGSAAHL